MNALQTHFWAVRDYLAPVLRESKFKEHGRITPEEFVAAGDFLSYRFPTWQWSSGEASKTRDFLPKDKQYLISRGVPCLKRVSQMEKDATRGGGGGGGGGGGKQVADEKMLSFADGKSGEVGTGSEDDWLATHTDTLDGGSNEQVGEIADIPDAPEGAASLTSGQEDELANKIASTSLHTQDTGAGEDEDDVGDIPDMDDEEDDEVLGAMGGIEEQDDPATASTIKPSTAANDPQQSGTNDNILSVRTYDCLITYDKYYQTPRMWLVGYDEFGVPLKTSSIFEDISNDYAQKTVTIEPFPHSNSLSTASIHPCKHANVMKKVIERMDNSVKEEQKRQHSKQKKKKKWGVSGLGGAMKKVTTRSTSGNSTPTVNDTLGSSNDDDPQQPLSPDLPTSPTTANANTDQSQSQGGEVEGLRVDQYLLVFLKFMASIVPAIEIDATQSF
ncbi:unnamed protein product [Sympodiomycopsis kandeliae]